MRSFLNLSRSAAAFSIERNLHNYASGRSGGSDVQRSERGSNTSNTVSKQMTHILASRWEASEAFELDRNSNVAA
jgi:hypothetical protein